jgi:DNA (cytosine-5)-methyltransferase 1
MVWENVCGSFSSNKGEDFRIVLEETAKVVDKNAVIPRPADGKWRTSGCILADGWSIAWRVFDAQFWGVPQRRRRIALVADFGGQSAPEILFVRKSVSRDTQPSKPKGEEATADASRGVGANDSIGCDLYNTEITVDITSTLGVNCGMSHGRQGVIVPMTYDARGNGDGKTVCTITGDHCNRVSDYTPVVCSDGDIAGTLDASYYKGTGSRSGIERTYVAQALGIGIQSSAGIGACNKEVMPTLINGDNFGWQNGVCHVQKAYGKRDKRCRYIVRRLTPLECERLQGYPDGWTDIGEWTDTNGKKHKIADAPRYKALGNSIALPSWKWVLKRLCACYERDATIASLFDGIGGFPLIFEQLNGKGTCLWASEIEEFPIAVTKARIGGK